MWTDSCLHSMFIAGVVTTGVTVESCQILAYGSISWLICMTPISLNTSQWIPHQNREIQMVPSSSGIAPLHRKNAHQATIGGLCCESVYIKAATIANVLVCGTGTRTIGRVPRMPFAQEYDALGCFSYVTKSVGSRFQLRRDGRSAPMARRRLANCSSPLRQDLR